MSLIEQKIVEKGAEMIRGLIDIAVRADVPKKLQSQTGPQSFTPMKQMNQHACSFAMYSHDISRKIETHRFIKRLNQDFLQCAVYDSDDSSARLIGVEYIVSEKIFESLPPEEQKLWHSLAYEVKSGLLIHPNVPEMVAKAELQNLAKSYGKFWCTWQADKGDKIPVGPPALMVSPQGLATGMVPATRVTLRDAKYKVKTEEMMKSRSGMEEPARLNPLADHWRQHGKGFVFRLQQTEMKRKP